MIVRAKDAVPIKDRMLLHVAPRFASSENIVSTACLAFSLDLHEVEKLAHHGMLQFLGSLKGFLPDTLIMVARTESVYAPDALEDSLLFLRKASKWNLGVVGCVGSQKTTSAFRTIMRRYMPHHRGLTWPASLPAAIGIATVARMNVLRGRR